MRPMRCSQESIATSRASVAETSDAMTFRYANLALVRMGEGDLPGGDGCFEGGRGRVMGTSTAFTGRSITDLADLECRTGRYSEGLARLDEAQPIVAKRYPDDPWRLAHLDNVRAGCLTRAKRYAEAESLMAASLPVLLPKWPADTLYGYDAQQRAIELYGLTGNTAEADPVPAALVVLEIARPRALATAAPGWAETQAEPLKAAQSPYIRERLPAGKGTLPREGKCPKKGAPALHDNALTSPESGLYCAPLQPRPQCGGGGKACGPPIKLTECGESLYSCGPFPGPQRRGVLFKNLAGNLCGDSRRCL